MLENKELEKFFTDVQEDIKATLLTEEDGTNPEQIFTDYTLAILSEAGETENYRVCYDEKISRRGVEHKVNGYALYENYETLDLFITIYNAGSTVQSVTKTDADKVIDRVIKFFRNAIYKDYVNELEESSEIFDLAHTLANVPEVKEFLTRVNIFLLTNGEVKSEISTTEKVAGYPVFYRVIDINYLFNLSVKLRIPIEIDFLSEGITVPCIEGPSENQYYQSYLAIISGEMLAAVYEQYGSRLLEQNLRSFLQFTGKINNKIRRTILEEQHMFLAFNNGIAATAEEIRIAEIPGNLGKTISYIKDFQIVNGGQTTASIYHTWKKNNADISQIFVQLKLTIIKDRKNFAEIVGRIAEYANTQNKVSASDLSSNKEYHVLLEKLSRAIWAPPKSGTSYQTRWFFERSRGQYKNERMRFGTTPSRRNQFDKQNPRNQMFTKELLAKYVNSFGEIYHGKKLVIGPHFVVRGSQKNYSQFLNYNFDRKPDNIYFEDAVALAILFISAEKIYGVKPSAIGDLRYITVPYAISWLGFHLDYDIDLFRIWQDQSISNPLRDLLYDIMVKVETFIKVNAPGSLYGEWAKKEECWNMLKENDLNIELGSIKDQLGGKASSRRRVSLSDSEIENKLIKSELELIRSIPLNKWSDISKLTSGIEEVSQHLKDRAVNILSTLKLGKQLSDRQRQDALRIIDTIISKAPDFFNEIQTSKPEFDSTRSKNIVVNIDQEFIIKMVEWDTKARVLTPNELQYLAGFAYGLSPMNDFHKQNIIRHLNRLIDAGFSP
jgi:hypothetical protein